MLQELLWSWWSESLVGIATLRPTRLSAQGKKLQAPHSPVFVGLLSAWNRIQLQRKATKALWYACILSKARTKQGSKSQPLEARLHNDHSDDNVSKKWPSACLQDMRNGWMQITQMERSHLSHPSIHYNFAPAKQKKPAVDLGIAPKRRHKRPPKAWAFFCRFRHRLLAVDQFFDIWGALHKHAIQQGQETKPARSTSLASPSPTCWNS